MSPMTHRTPFTCIEVTGIDGAGKSTVSQMIADDLGWRAAKVRPFDRDTVQKDVAIRKEFGKEASDSYRGCCLSKALLEAASSITTDTVFDRYIESARMWWQVKDVPPVDDDVLLRLPQPLLVIHLEIPVDVGLARRKGTSEHSSTEEISFLKRCSAYLNHCARREESWVVVDGTRPLADVVAQALRHVRGSLGQRPSCPKPGRS